MSEQTPLSQVKEAAAFFTSVFRNDLSLVAQTARRHHIQTSSGSLVLLPVYGAHNLRLPNRTDLETRRILEAKKVLIACMDYRASAQVVAITEADIFLLMAGGAAQPNENRLSSLTDMIVIVHDLNPSAKIILLGHNGVCGGVDHFTDGKISRMTPEEEMMELNIHYRNLAARLLQRGVNPIRLQFGTALIGSDNNFNGIKY